MKRMKHKFRTTEPAFHSCISRQNCTPLKKPIDFNCKWVPLIWTRYHHWASSSLSVDLWIRFIPWMNRMSKKQFQFLCVSLSNCISTQRSFIGFLDCTESYCEVDGECNSHCVFQPPNIACFGCEHKLWDSGGWIPHLRSGIFSRK